MIYLLTKMRTAISGGFSYLEPMGFPKKCGMLEVDRQFFVLVVSMIQNEELSFVFHYRIHQQ